MLSRAASEIAISVGQHSIAGRKSRNDDSYGVLLPEKALLATKGVAIAIADGMSSSEAAKEASETCVRSFLDDYFATPPSWTVKTSIERVLCAANRWMQSQSEALSAEGRGMVSTFSGAVLKSSIAHIFHVGDSRIYLLRDRHIEQLTNDHRVRLSRQQEYLSRAFGMERDLAVDYRKLPVERGDFLIFTTDGVHDFLSGAQIANIILSTPGDDLNGAAERIVSAAFAKGSPDNLTCQIVRIDDPGAPDQQAQSERLSALPFPPELFAGSDFEGYAIIRELHLSKRTQVYLGEDKATGEIVAIKTPSVNFEDDARYIEMFTREEWVGRLVSSPHVLKVLHADRARRSLYYVTEYFEGQTLRQWMLDHPSRDLETVRRLVEQIAKGLRAFHRKEILHRDLKPENILIDRNGACKIIDFGSAWVAGIEEAAGADGESFAGTVGYTAPEYFRGEPPTTRSDIYSLGVIAYELLTGHPPYGRGFASGKDVDRLDYISARRFRKDLPAWVDAAIEEAVRKNPQRRTAVLSAFVEDLRKPNPSLKTGGFVPLMERDPVTVWRVFAILLAVLNIVLLFLLSR